MSIFVFKKLPKPLFKIDENLKDDSSSLSEIKSTVKKLWVKVHPVLIKKETYMLFPEYLEKECLGDVEAAKDRYPNGFPLVCKVVDYVETFGRSFVTNANIKRRFSKINLSLKSHWLSLLSWLVDLIEWKRESSEQYQLEQWRKQEAEKNEREIDEYIKKVVKEYYIMVPHKIVEDHYEDFLDVIKNHLESDKNLKYYFRNLRNFTASNFTVNLRKILYGCVKELIEVEETKRKGFLIGASLDWCYQQVEIAFRKRMKQQNAA